MFVLILKDFTRKGNNTKIRRNALSIMKNNEMHKKEDMGIMTEGCGQGRGT